MPEYIGSAGIGASDAVDAVLIMTPAPLRCSVFTAIRVPYITPDRLTETTRLIFSRDEAGHTGSPQIVPALL
ncbi:MAG: hypothetical protein ABGY43_11970 [bacterium]